MKEIKGSIEIDAPIERVWEVITDFESYPQWNPFIVKMKGNLKLGSIYEVVVRPPGRKDTKFTSKVVDIKHGTGIVFKGKIKRGLMSDDHVFSVEPLEMNKTRFFQSIVFKGIMVPLAGGVINDCQIGIDQMNKATKKRCELR